MKKLRTVSLLLALVMCLGLFPAAASAAESATVRLYDEHSTSKIQVTEGEPFGSALPAPSKSGKVFLGWYTNIGSMNFALGDYVDNSTVYDKSRHGTALYAMWSYGTDYLTVNLDPQGGTVQPATAKAYQCYYDYNLEYRVDGTMLMELPVPVRPGYKFMGWCEDIHGVTASLYNSSHSFMPYRNADIKLYAIWEADGTATEPTQPTQPEKPAVTFSDVPAGAWYADAVSWAIAKGITNGTGTNTFSPKAQCTNAQIITFLYRAAGSPAVSGVALPFAINNAWAGDALKWAYSRNVIDNGFDEEAPCTRYNAVGYIWRAFGCPTAQGGTNFGDIAGLDARPITWAVENGIVNGTSATTFSPSLTCDRATILTLLYRAYK